jgi:hypothetical protein
MSEKKRVDVNESPRTNRLPISYFDPKEIGHSLKEVAQEVMRLDQTDIVSQWFHSNKDADLYIWKDEKGNVIKQQLTFYGTVIEWNIIEGVRTGYLLEEESSAGIDKSPLIRYDNSPQKQSLEQGIHILQHIQGLTASDKNNLIVNYIQSPVFDSYSHSELTQRFGLEETGILKTFVNTWLQLYNKLGIFKKKK